SRAALARAGSGPRVPLFGHRWRNGLRRCNLSHPAGRRGAAPLRDLRRRAQRPRDPRAPGRAGDQGGSRFRAHARGPRRPRQRGSRMAAVFSDCGAASARAANRARARQSPGLSGARGARWLDVLPPPPGAPEPGYYAFDAAGVHFTILDSNALRSPRQLAWCEQDLARAGNARALFVALHDGPWSVGFHGGNADALRSYVPLFQKYGVSMVFSGHDHDYERGQKAGLDYIVSGGGGAPLYPPRCGAPNRVPCPATTLAVTPEYHYVLVEVHRDDYLICPKRIDGTALEPCVDLPVRHAK